MTREEADWTAWPLIRPLSESETPAPPACPALVMGLVALAVVATAVLAAASVQREKDG